jgi:AraC-like DNA-binding protein
MSRGNFEGFDHKHLAAGLTFIRHWPTSLYDHVKHVTQGRSGSIRVLLGRLGKFVDQNGLASPLRRLMDIELPNAIAVMDVPIKAYKDRGIVNGRREGVISLSDAAAMFGVDKKVIGKLQDSSDCVVSRGKSKSSLILLKQEAVRESLNSWRSGITHIKAAVAIGAPPYVIPALVEIGLLQAVDSPNALLLADGAALVTTESIRNLQQAIATSASLAITGVASDTFQDAMAQILHPTTWVEVIGALIQGEISHTAPVDDKRFLHQIDVSSGGFARFRRLDEARPLPDHHVSGVVAADLLAVSNTLVSGAVRIGLIRGSSSPGRIDIPLAEVRRYGRELIGAEEVLREFRIRSQELSAAMRTAGCQPAGQIYNTFYWRRSEVLKVVAQLPEREAPSPGGQAALVSRFGELVNVHFRDGLTLQNYADLLGVTTERLYSACANFAGRSPLRLVHERVFREAKSALLGSNSSVAEISASLGFNDATYFSRFFAKAAGCSPRTFRMRRNGASEATHFLGGTEGVGV